MSEPSAEQMIADNLAALNEGTELPYDEEGSVAGDATVEKPEVEPREREVYEPEGLDIDTEAIAEKDGWVTPEEWEESGKDPEDYLTKEEFAKVGELRDNKDDYTRQDLAKTNVLLQKSIQEMMRDNQKRMDDLEQRTRADERAKLEAAKKEAIEYGNAEEAVEIQQQISDMERPVQPQQPQVDPQVQQFFQENQYWYGKAQGATDLLNVHLGRAEAQGLPFDEAIKPAMQKVKAAFPDYFDEPRSKPKPAVRPRQAAETATRKPKSGKKYTLADLDPSMRPIAARAIKASGMNTSDYVKDILGE